MLFRSLKQAELGEPPLDGNNQVPIQGNDCQNTTFFRFQVAILTAGSPLPLSEGHEGAPATLVDLSILSGVRTGEARMGLLKVANYWG